MLERVEVKNFQAHTDTTIDFDKGVNVIAGSSDNGKSSIIRAIRWVLMNRPSGFAFHTHRATEDTEVTLTFDNASVSRFKGLKDNGGYKYLENKFAALRTDVPPEIRQVLNMEAINIQSQHDPYYLLQDSPGDVAKKMNVVAGLSIIGDTIQNANTIVRKRKEDVGFSVATEATIKNSIASMEWVEKYQDDVNALEQEEDRIASLHTQISILSDIIAGMKHATEKTYRASTILRHVQEYEQLASSIEKRKNIQKTIETLQTITYQMIESQKKAVKADKIKRFGPSIERLVEMKKAIDDSKTLLVSLAAMTKNMLACKGSLEIAKLAVTEYEKKIRELKEAYPLCPTCGKPWKEDGQC